LNALPKIKPGSVFQLGLPARFGSIGRTGHRILAKKTRCPVR